MATAETKQKILDAAERLFAEHGYAATSMRQLVNKAGVNLAAVHYHFQSKQELFIAVVERRLRPLNEQRMQLLNELEEAADGKPPTVERLVAALIEPIFRLGDDAQDVAWRKLIGRSRVEAGDHWRIAGELHKQMFDRYVDAFRRALPEIPPRELAYRVYFLTGSVANALIDTRTMEVLGHGLARIGKNPRLLQKRVVALGIAIMEAPLSRANVL
ncbi:MAG: TetR/AcrR family transcriptional regulator [Phycisphaerales bacterium]